MEVLQHILDNTQYSFITAIVLGLMTAISPCPLATNISAVGFISRDLKDPRRVFTNGLVYTLGRVISYTGLPVFIFAWLLAYAVGNVGKLYNQIKTFELWFRRVVSVAFIGIGIYYVIIFFL